MIYLKCVLAGLAAAILTIVVWIAVEVSRLLIPSLLSDNGGLGAVSGSSDVMLPVAVAGFALGFWLMWRRERRKLV